MAVTVTARQATAATLLAVTVATAVLTAIDVPGPVRLVLTLAFVLLAPGWAVVGYLRTESAAFTWTVSVAVSLSVVTVLSQTLLQLGAWYPEPALWALMVITAVPLAHHLLRAQSGEADRS